jgi:hypothetical protein
MTQPGQANSAIAPVDTLTSVPPPAPIQVGSNGSPGGYKFDPDQVQGVLSKWKALLDNLQNDISQAQRIANVQPPGAEFASDHFVQQGATRSGDTLLQQHQRMREYVQNYIDALEKASGQMAQSEDNAQQAVAQQGQGTV